MNSHKYLSLILAVVLLPAVLLNPVLEGSSSHSTEATVPGLLLGIPGANAKWWEAVQETFGQVPGQSALQLAGIDGLSLIPDWMGESNLESTRYGYSVGTAGDVNGDGYDDVIVGIPFYTDEKIYEGAAAVYLGSADGLSLISSWFAVGDQAEAYFGESVGTAGDVNGDGYDDVIVGAFRYDHGQTNEGAAAVYHGSATGLAILPSWWGESNQAEAAYGQSVRNAGDVNGDGYDDVIIGAPMFDKGQTNEGAAAVYFGSASGLDDVPGWLGESNQAFTEFGRSVGTAGDVNGDGYADVIIGVPYYSNGEDTEGGAAVYYGRASGLIFVPDWWGEGNQVDAYYGYRVNTAGDVNNDGFDDVIIGAPWYDLGEEDEGAAAVYLGSASGLALFYSWLGEGDQEMAEFGYSVGTAGDVNGDGYDDVIIGAHFYDNGEMIEGMAVVYHGSASGLSWMSSWRGENNQAMAEFGISVGTAGDVNGDGVADIIVGASVYDHGESDEGAAFVYHGHKDFSYSYLPVIVKGP